MASLTTSYYTLDGEIIGESTGGVRVDYQVDALGSVTGHIDQTGVSINKARYKPYGGLLSGTQYAVGWCGTLGYRTKSTLKSADVYVRARSYGTKLGQWGTRDPLWPSQRTYAYVKGSPTLRTDSSGLSLDLSRCNAASSQIYSGCCADLRKAYGTRRLAACVEEKVHGHIGDSGWEQVLKDMLAALYLSCSATPFSPKTCVLCPTGVRVGLPDGLGQGCHTNGCANGVGGYALCTSVKPIAPEPKQFCASFNDSIRNKWGCAALCDSLADAGCYNSVVVCETVAKTGPCTTFYHELLHTYGYQHYHYGWLWVVDISIGDCIEELSRR